MAVAHASRSTALIETSRYGAIGGRRMILAKGNTNGAPVMIRGVDLRSIVINAIHIARFWTLSGADFVITPPGAVISLYFLRRKVRSGLLNETRITKVILLGGTWAKSHYCALIYRRAKVSAYPTLITKVGHVWG